MIPAGTRRLAGAAAIAAMILLSAAGQAAAQEKFRRTPPLPDPRQELKLPVMDSYILPNGLTVATALGPGRGLAVIELIVGAGEADCPARLPGLALVTARMLGKGTRQESSEEIQNDIEAIGADLTVTVSMEHTILKMIVLEENLDRALSILRRMMLEPDFSERELAVAKRNVYYDLRNSRQDPEFAGMRQLVRLLFPGHPYLAGAYAEDAIKFIGLKDVVSFFQTFYRPGDTVLLVTGDITLSSAVKKAGQHLAAWASRPSSRKPVPPVPAQNNRERISFLEVPSARGATVLIGNTIPFPASDAQAFPFAVLGHILGGTTGSRLFMRLREARGVAYYAFCETKFYREGGLFWIRARSKPEDVGRVIRETIDELRAVSSAGFSVNEIEQAKSYLVGNFPLTIEKPEAFADRLARIISLDLGEASWSKFIDNIMLVNLDKVNETASRYLAATPVVLVAGQTGLLTQLIKEFANIEVFDQFGSLKQILTKGEEDK